MLAQTTGVQTEINLEVEAACVAARFRLLKALEQSPDLVEAAALARLDYVTAVIAMGRCRRHPWTPSCAGARCVIRWRFRQNRS